MAARVERRRKGRAGVNWFPREVGEIKELLGEEIVGQRLSRGIAGGGDKLSGGDRG